MSKQQAGKQLERKVDVGAGSDVGARCLGGIGAERQRLDELQERRAKLERRPDEIPGERQPLMHRIEVVVTPRRKSFATGSMTQKGRERFARRQDRRRQATGAREYGLQQPSVPHCLLLPSKRIGRTKVRSVSGTAAGGGGNGAARVSKESASASSTDEPELLMI